MLHFSFVLPERRNNLSSCWAAYRNKRWDPQCQQKRHGVSKIIWYTENLLTNLAYRSPESNVLVVGWVFILFSCLHRSFFSRPDQPPESVLCQAEQSRHWSPSAFCVLQVQCGSGAEEDKGGQQPGAGTDHSTHWGVACHLWVTSWLSPAGQSIFDQQGISLATVVFIVSWWIDNFHTLCWRFLLWQLPVEMLCYWKVVKKLRTPTKSCISSLRKPFPCMECQRLFS